MQEYAIYAEQSIDAEGKDTGNAEMKEGMPDRAFNIVEAQQGESIQRIKNENITDPIFNYTRIQLAPGTYRISGMSFITMLTAVEPIPTQFLINTYPGYCVLYDAMNPPALDNMTGVICLGTLGTAYDSGPSLFDCVLKCETKRMIALGHQCTYDNPQKPFPKAYLRVGGTPYHVFSRISIFKIAEPE